MENLDDRRKHPRAEPWETTVVFWKNGSGFKRNDFNSCRAAQDEACQVCHIHVLRFVRVEHRTYACRILLWRHNHRDFLGNSQIRILKYACGWCNGVCVIWTTYSYYAILQICKNMVVTTRMFHQMSKSGPTISDIERIDSELRSKKRSEIPIQNN